MQISTSYEDWLYQWLDQKKFFIKTSTYATYSNVIANQIVPFLGRFPIQDITEDLIQQAVLFWLDHSISSYKQGLSETTIRDVLMLVKLSLRDAQKYYQLPIQHYKVRCPKSYRSQQPRTFSKPDQQKLAAALTTEITAKNCGILLAMCTGLRIGELCALTWKDIHLHREYISITKTLQRILTKSRNGANTSQVIITPPKTPSSIRDIPLSKQLIPFLKQLQPSNRNFYFLTGTTKHMEPRIYRLYYSSFLKKQHIEHINFHGLRHTFATNLISSGADIKTVSELLGHSSVTTTLNLYTHPSLEHKRQCIELITL